MAAVVIDAGSEEFKVGFAGDAAPRVVFPAVVGRPKVPGMMFGGQMKDVFVGSEVTDKRGAFTIKHPIEFGLVADWEDTEKLWANAFSVLNVNAEDQAVLLTEPILNPRSSREKIVTSMFETFNIPALYLGVQATMALYTTGQNTGVVLDSGSSTTQIVPIKDGAVIYDGVSRTDIGGREIKGFLTGILIGRGYHLTSIKDQEAVSEMLKTTCIVAQDYQQPSYSTVYYTLPTGDTIELNREIYEPPEILFQPALMGKAVSGVHTNLHRSITKCDENIRKALYGNILVTGGNTLLPGFSERIEKELRALDPSTQDTLKITALPERKYLTWNGASIFASLPSFQSVTISKEEYYENGPGIINSKCPVGRTDLDA